MESIGDWFKQNNKNVLLDRWDYDLNKISPFEVSRTDKNKYYFKCPRDLHPSQEFHINKFHTGKAKILECKACKSIAQKLIDMYDKDTFYRLWSHKNNVNPWEIGAQSNQRCVFNCDNGYEHDYITSCLSKSQGNKCGVCSNRIKNKINSLGSKYPEVFKLWSDKNQTTPYDYSHHSVTEVWWKCENGIHEDYLRKIASSTDKKYKCPICAVESLGGRLENLTGNIYGEWTVLSFDSARFEDDHSYYWICQCSCGKIKSVAATSLVYGKSLKCQSGIHRSGKNNGNWKDGKTSELLSARTSKSYDEWRYSVYKKDWYTCQCCGKTNINLNAHHFYNFSKNKNIRYDVSNGITLCEECHHINFKGSFHNIYGTRNNTPEQLEEYINSRRKELGIDIPFTIQNYLNGSILKPFKAG